MTIRNTDFSKMAIKRLLIILFVLINYIGFSQAKLNDIDFNLIPQRKIKEFIKMQINRNQIYFDDIKASCNNKKDIQGFYYQEKQFIINDNISKVWHGYLYANPSYSWQGDILSFGMLLSKKSNTITYKNQNYRGIELGQVFYVNLRLWHGIYNLAAVFELTDIDSEKHKIEFSYINGNITQGKQIIEFKAIDKHKTLITHYSFFKSQSAFRDKFLYPFFHSRVVNEFHKNMNQLIKNDLKIKE